VTSGGFKIKSTTPFITYNVNEKLSWEIEINGGTLPYRIAIDWGDGYKTNFVQTSSGLIKINHIYRNNKTYLVKLTANDKSGESVVISLAAITLEQKRIPSVFGASGIDVTGNNNVWRNITVAYLLVILAVSGFWLGSKKELANGKFKNQKSKR
jgi:hypothetical protein